MQFEVIPKNMPWNAKLLITHGYNINERNIIGINFDEALLNKRRKLQNIFANTEPRLARN